ncbi:Glycosyltransferase involved in cell wall bisynthesis [Paenibacillus algorifonticola]|uniref:Glycosyltransferase involved in cell wall bisynthesis n=1 Tax=Paenibacillus algorifonticola TaxID=684063 RepID=A0A1I1YAZ2_9BACL|nr:glycosyltransferase family 1 protein [Paenibacillus algorifonticola]SFE15273.1 Glycosyltransferase involved in cell wall bisynthesis [Paenibacillus algorifonticola]
MRILIWSAQFSIGGGMRLLHNLIVAIARQPEIEHIRLVISPDSLMRNVLEIQALRNVEIVTTQNAIDAAENSYLLVNVDVVYYYWPHTHPYHALDRPTLCTFHDTTLFDYVPPFLTGEQLKQHWTLSKKWLDHVTSVAVSSEYVKSRLIAHFGSRHHAAAVIPHAITPIAAQYADQVSPAVAAQIPPEYIIYPSNTSPHKNHNNLLLALSEWKESPKYPLVLTGYLTDTLRQPFSDCTPQYSWLPTLISTMVRTGLMVNRDVYPLGFVGDEDIPALIKNAKALIMPSLSEGGGSYPVEEALRLGTPVLCSDIPVMREHLSRHTAQIIWFNPHNPDSILQALKELSSNYSTYKSSAIQGMSDPSESWDDVAKRYIDVFRITYWRYYGKQLP